MWEGFELAGPAVRLRRLELADAEALAQAAGAERSTFRYTWVPTGVEGARAYIAATHRAMESGARLPLATLFEGELVGSTSFLAMQPWSWPEGSPLQRHERPDAVEIGATWLAPAAQRTRCNTEAKLLMLTHAFESWRVYGVRFRTDERNRRSRTAIERLGASLDGVIRADYPAQDGRPRNSASYSIVAEEWPSIRVRLRERLER